MRVLIVGAGPTGLVLALALLKAGIEDLIILERRQAVVEASGAGIGLWPHSVRVLDQLGNGILESAQEMVPRMKRNVRLGNEGNIVLSTDMYEHIEENHGHPFMLFERMRFIELMYTHLPRASELVLTGKSVTSLSQTDKLVSVTCDDGSEYTGDILIGADGVHSITRSLLFGGLEERRTKLANGFSASFRCIFGCGPLLPGLVPGEMIERSNGPISFQMLISDDTVMWFFYQRLEKTTTNRSHYSDAEMEELAETFKDFHVVEDRSVFFGDLWQTRRRARLADLEEGIISQWSKGRVALVGDATHKMLPNLALGGNCAIESAVSLVNRLHALVQTNPTTSTQDLETIFTAYQQEREPRARLFTRLSGLMLRHWWLLAKFLGFVGRFTSLENDRTVTDKVLTRISKPGLVLDFVPEAQPKTGKIPWDISIVRVATG